MATAKKTAKKSLLARAAQAVTGVIDDAMNLVTPSSAPKRAPKKAPAKKVIARKAPAKKSAAKKTMDRKLIALSQDYEVRDWCKSFGCTEVQLREAVKAVGRSSGKVREYLQKK